MKDAEFQFKLQQCKEHLRKLSSQKLGINHELEVQATKLGEVALWYSHNQRHLSEWVA